MLDKEGKWLDPESNRGHEDFQSSALPTELSSRGEEKSTMRIFRTQEFILTRSGRVGRGAGIKLHLAEPEAVLNLTCEQIERACLQDEGSVVGLAWSASNWWGRFSFHSIGCVANELGNH